MEWPSPWWHRCGVKFVNEGENSFKDECSQKLALIEDFKAAMAEIFALHQKEFDALVRRDFGAVSELQARLDVSREYKTGIIRRYRSHLAVHGC